MIKEDLLHFLWKSHLIPKNGEKTTDGKSLDILSVGILNKDNGPDFLQAKIRIDNVLWVGSVEIHIKSSDWFRHNHHHDRRYNNVILHVVLEEDKPVCNPVEEEIPCLEVNKYLHPGIIKRYKDLQGASGKIPCSMYDSSGFDEEFQFMRDRLLNERLFRKTSDSDFKTKSYKEILQRLIFVAVGNKKNKDAFATLAGIVDWNLLDRWMNKPEYIEFYLKKISGLFETEEVDEIVERKVASYTTKTLVSEHWNTKAVRPLNQPRNRIVQLIELMKDRRSLILLTAVTTPQIYSERGHVFLQELKEKRGYSDFLISTIAINALIPFAYLVGLKSGDESWIDFSFTYLEDWRPEKNRIIDLYRGMGIHPKTAADTQAILELNSYYCSSKRCTLCSRGKKLMSG